MGVESVAIGTFLASNAGYIAAANMAIAVGAAVAAHQAQAQAAANQQKQNNAAAESATRARNNQAQQLQTRALQERDAASEKILETRVQALEGEGTARAHGAGSGIEGGTVDALAREYWSKQGRAESAITTTSNNTVQQLAAETLGVQSNYESRLNALPEPREPSLWGLGLGITQAAATGARDSVRSETRNPTATTRI